MMGERERFETRFRPEFMPADFSRMPDGTYADRRIGARWEAWQAAKAEAAERERALMAELYQYKGMIGDAMIVTALIAEALDVESEPHQTANERLLKKARALVAEVERLRDALDDIARASPDMGYDYDDLQGVALDALAQHESKEASDDQ